MDASFRANKPWLTSAVSDLHPCGYPSRFSKSCLKDPYQRHSTCSASWAALRVIIVATQVYQSQLPNQRQ